MSSETTPKTGTHMTASRLRGERGWTEELIRQHLGEPDRKEENPHRAAGPPMRLYRLERVDQIVEEDPALAAQLAANTREKASQARQQSGMRETDLIAEAARTVVTMLPLPSEKAADLIELALQRRREYSLKEHGIEKPSAVDPNGRFAQELAIKMLRHEFTDYHELIERIPRAKKHEANTVIHRAIQRRTIERIAEAVPELAERCAEMIDESGA